MTPTLDDRSLDVWGDAADRRQAARSGHAWPTHKARRRNRRRRARQERRADA